MAIGETALLTVTVPAKVVTVTVGDTELTQFTLLEDGRKQFCDRIVDTYVSFRLEPLMDRILTKSATACRKGLGTSATVAEAYSAMARCSEDFTRDCWVQTYDCQSYYMSMDRELLLNMILSLFDFFWEGDPMEAEICKWLITLPPAVSRR